MSPHLLGLQAIAHHMAPVLQRMRSPSIAPAGRPASCSSRGRLSKVSPNITVIPLSSKPHLQGSCTSMVPATTLCFTLQFLWTWHGVFQGLGWGLCLSEGPLIAAFLTVKMSIRYWWLSPLSQHWQQNQSVELFVAHTGGMSQGGLLIDSQSINILLIVICQDPAHCQAGAVQLEKWLCWPGWIAPNRKTSLLCHFPTARHVGGVSSRAFLDS